MNKKRISLLFIILSATLLSTCTAPTTQGGKEAVQEINWGNKVIYEVNIRQFTPEGTFAAFEEHLPRLKELGVDILWMMPIFPIGEKNRKGSLGSYYAVKDYQDVNPEFGTLEEFKMLVDKIHAMDMYVILDWVANHSAWDNPLIYEHEDWYTKDSTGAIVPPVPDWSDVADFNYDNEELREYMSASLEFWVKEADVDGYRCDVAGMVPTDFWEETRIKLDSIKPVFMLAEWESAELLVNAFDMDYGWHLLHIMNAIAKGEMDATQIDVMLSKNDTIYASDDIRMYFTTNHDENSWNGTVFERYGDGAKAFSVLCFTLNGMPLLYSGQEAGLNKALSFFEKDTIHWEENEFTAFYQKLTELKHENPALLCGEDAGEFMRIPTSNDMYIYAFMRQKGEHKVLVILNMTGNTLTESIESELIEGKYNDLFSSAEIILGSRLDIEMEPWDYEVYVK